MWSTSDFADVKKVGRKLALFRFFGDTDYFVGDLSREVIIEEMEFQGYRPAGRNELFSVCPCTFTGLSTSCEIAVIALGIRHANQKKFPAIRTGFGETIRVRESRKPWWYRSYFLAVKK